MNEPARNYLAEQLHFRTEFGLIEQDIPTHEYWLSSRSPCSTGVICRDTGDDAVDNLAKRCPLIQFELPSCAALPSTTVVLFPRKLHTTFELRSRPALPPELESCDQFSVRGHQKIIRRRQRDAGE